MQNHQQSEHVSAPPPINSYSSHQQLHVGLDAREQREEALLAVQNQSPVCWGNGADCRLIVWTERQELTAAPRLASGMASVPTPQPASQKVSPAAAVPSASIHFRHLSTVSWWPVRINCLHARGQYVKIVCANV